MTKHPGKAKAASAKTKRPGKKAVATKVEKQAVAVKKETRPRPAQQAACLLNSYRRNKLKAEVWDAEVRHVKRWNIPPCGQRKKLWYREITYAERADVAKMLWPLIGDPESTKTAIRILAWRKMRHKATIRKIWKDALEGKCKAGKPKGPVKLYWIVELTIKVGRMTLTERASDASTAKALEMDMPTSTYQGYKPDIMGALFGRVGSMPRTIDIIHCERDPQATTKLCNFIGMARRTLEVSYYSFTHKMIAEALVAAKEGEYKVQVRVLLDRKKALEGPEAKITRYLREHGIEIRYYPERMMHLKEIILDGEYVAWGTANGSGNGMDGDSKEVMEYQRGIHDLREVYEEDYAISIPDEVFVKAQLLKLGQYGGSI